MPRAATIRRVALALYMLVFFLYLFGPLVVMGITAFNASTYPAVVPFEGFTLGWFEALIGDAELLYGLRQSLWIGLLVVLVSVPVGLAAAMVMSQVYPRARGLYYVVAVSPVLTPGVIIGISTVVFWRDLTLATGTRTLFNGTLLTVLGQVSFISAYCLLIFLSRLQRFDRSLEEAALDLGATRTQVFLHVFLPFMRPAIFSAAVLAFLSSFENYNTTTFSILADKTLVTVLAGRVRQGTTPSLSALAVLIVAVTLVAAILYEVVKRREERQLRARRRSADEANAIEAAGPPILAPA